MHMTSNIFRTHGMQTIIKTTCCANFILNNFCIFFPIRRQISDANYVRHHISSFIYNRTTAYTLVRKFFFFIGLISFRLRMPLAAIMSSDRGMAPFVHKVVCLYSMLRLRKKKTETENPNHTSRAVSNWGASYAVWNDTVFPLQSLSHSGTFSSRVRLWIMIMAHPSTKYLPVWKGNSGPRAIQFCKRQLHTTGKSS